MKKFVAALLAIVTLLTLCACGGSKGSSENNAGAAEVRETLPPVATSQAFPAETPALVEVEEQVGWVWDGTGWRWVFDNGLAAAGRWEWLDGDWYYFNNEGYAMYNTWMDADGYRYWFKESCAAAQSETITIDGVEYTFDDECHLVS